MLERSPQAQKGKEATPETPKTPTDAQQDSKSASLPNIEKKKYLVKKKKKKNLHHFSSSIPWV